MAPRHYISGSLNPLLASIPPELQETDFGDCSPTDLGWSGDLSEVAERVPHHRPRAVRAAINSRAQRSEDRFFRVDRKP
jgi:hypothetical protein